MLIEVDDYDIKLLLKGLGFDEYELLGYYVDDCCCDGWNVKQWIENTYNHTIYCFNNREETLEYIEQQGLKLDENCSIYEGFLGNCVLDVD